MYYFKDILNIVYEMKWWYLDIKVEVSELFGIYFLMRWLIE